ncbi:hypothetical protein TNIN_421821 [Trichonephila inaurata madagascariensis]|uniref:UBA-like domain-containing protein n=1 Tax=Trichonephila inaurata madagascariensis TaxID=2747483 RepID=A0A8X7CKS8_9ARAC|nr:hypothetical protein TNIN_421821 [Trichonephila inaurata madagascariensis]
MNCTSTNYFFPFLSMDSDDSDNSEDIPEVSECQRLCECFAEITGTDEACAQFYLQDRKWDLEATVLNEQECTKITK